MSFWNDVEILKGPVHARLGDRPKSGIGPSFEPPDQSDEPRRVPEVQAADQMTDFNDTNSIMRGHMSVQSDPNRQLAARHAASMAMRSSFSDADRRMARTQEQQNAARDEYLLNLFRRADQNCTHQVEPAQQDAWGGQGPGTTGRSPQQLTGQALARPSFNLPGYPAHGLLPVHGNPSSAGSQEPHKVDAAGSGAIQSMLPSAGSVLNPAKVKSKIGKQAYAAVRQKILEHMESFVENIYDLHRLTRRQHHLESICDDKEAYAAELQSLMLPSGAQEKAATGGSPEKVEEAGRQEKETEASDERKGSNEPILPVEEVLATALSSKSHSDCPAGPGAVGQPGADLDNDATGAAGSLKNIGRSLRQASVQDLEMQHRNMAVAQEQMQQSMAAAHQAQEQQQRSMELAAQQQHQHHQSMAAAYRQSAGQQGVSQLPLQSAKAQDPRAGPAQLMRPHSSQNDVTGGVQAAGTQQQNGNQVQQSLSNAMPNQQQPDEQPVMADMQQGELGTPRNNFPPYINPYQSFANSGTMQNNMGAFSGYGGFNQAFYPGSNSFNNSNGQGYNAYTMMGTGGLSFDPMFAWYAHHYGRGAAQAQAQAQAQQAAADMQAEEDAAAAKKEPAQAPAASKQEGGGDVPESRGRSASGALPVHWWQDPQAAFGAAVPADARQRDQGLSASAGRPARPASAQPASRQSREQTEWVPPKQRMKQRHSAVQSGMVEATGQTSGGRMAANRSNTFGFGGSAFRKVAQRPWGFRSLQRADSVGSETSRSKSSIGAASGRRHTDAASPPEQLQSAANILAGLSSQRPS